MLFIFLLIKKISGLKEIRQFDLKKYKLICPSLIKIDDKINLKKFLCKI